MINIARLELTTLVVQIFCFSFSFISYTFLTKTAILKQRFLVMIKSNWTIEDAKSEYQIPSWSDGYFEINSKGELCANPNQIANGPIISLKEIVDEIKTKNIEFPCVIRFQDILRHQVIKLNTLFQTTIKAAKFKGKYNGVFPIKVNQLREVVEEVVDAGSEFDYGLEAGSKAELIAALTYNTNPNALTVLNGYKDNEYFKLAFLGTKLGRKMVIVVEKFSEIHQILKLSKELGIEPMLGVRAKLSSKSSGMWSESSGDSAKFGLSIPEIIDFIELLKNEDKIHMLKLFHFHVGSQIPDIRTIKDCLSEGARIYCNLIKLGCDIKYFDVGGGVGINYDGSKSNCPSSTNYSLKDYVGDVVYILKDICDENDSPHPNIVSESGRVISAHHSCVVTNVFGSIKQTQVKKVDTSKNENDHLLLKNIKTFYRNLNHSNYQDIYNDACLVKEETVSAFKLGVIDLVERAHIENIYWSICSKIILMTENEEDTPKEIANLKYTHADKYLCNFSVFQSTPDSWAINQILPVIPLSKLNQEPTIECTLADITCDSDGKLSNFIGPEGHQKTLALHEISSKEDYHIGIFLTGAYQDVMGDMHNLFGRLNEVHVYLDDDDPNDFYIEEVIHGHKAKDVLKIMQYNPDEMCRLIKNKIDSKVKEGQIRPRVGVELTDLFEESINNYTYLNFSQS